MRAISGDDEFFSTFWRVVRNSGLDTKLAAIQFLNQTRMIFKNSEMIDGVCGLLDERHPKMSRLVIRFLSVNFPIDSTALTDANVVMLVKSCLANFSHEEDMAYEKLLDYLFSNSESEARSTRLIIAAIEQFVKGSALDFSFLAFYQFNEERGWALPEMKVITLLNHIHRNPTVYRTIFHKVFPLCIRNINMIYRWSSTMDALNVLMAPIDAATIWASIGDYCEKKIAEGLAANLSELVPMFSVIMVPCVRSDPEQQLKIIETMLRALNTKTILDTCEPKHLEKLYFGVFNTAYAIGEARPARDGNTFERLIFIVFETLLFLCDTFEASRSRQMRALFETTTQAIHKMLVRIPLVASRNTADTDRLPGLIVKILQIIDVRGWKFLVDNENLEFDNFKIRITLTRTLHNLYKHSTAAIRRHDEALRHFDVVDAMRLAPILGRVDYRLIVSSRIFEKVAEVMWFGMGRVRISYNYLETSQFLNDIDVTEGNIIQHMIVGELCSDDTRVRNQAIEKIVSPYMALSDLMPGHWNTATLGNIPSIRLLLIDI
ncbi:unnamed protein product [Caenorhabditis bovis]|uniref:Uncharacterized protein n=1 Tax=Caenorhabditis bovis TaxID=2654633 RepID=A0A8S1EY99_9PELO|nr:unnamed protein product [Caenorhabditis bovis]